MQVATIPLRGRIYVADPAYLNHMRRKRTRELSYIARVPWSHADVHIVIDPEEGRPAQLLITSPHIHIGWVYLKLGRLAGHLGVDSGQMAVAAAPKFDFDSWVRSVDLNTEAIEGRWWRVTDGVFHTMTLVGDGLYPIYEIAVQGKLAALIVYFG